MENNNDFEFAANYWLEIPDQIKKMLTGSNETELMVANSVLRNLDSSHPFKKWASSLETSLNYINKYFILDSEDENKLKLHWTDFIFNNPLREKYIKANRVSSYSLDNIDKYTIYIAYQKLFLEVTIWSFDGSVKWVFQFPVDIYSKLLKLELEKTVILASQHLINLLFNSSLKEVNVSFKTAVNLDSSLIYRLYSPLQKFWIKTVNHQLRITGPSTIFSVSSLVSYWADVLPSLKTLNHHLNVESLENRSNTGGGVLNTVYLLDSHLTNIFWEDIDDTSWFGYLKTNWLLKTKKELTLDLVLELFKFLDINYTFPRLSPITNQTISGKTRNIDSSYLMTSFLKQNAETFKKKVNGLTIDDYGTCIIFNLDIIMVIKRKFNLISTDVEENLGVIKDNFTTVINLPYRTIDLVEKPGLLDFQIKPIIQWIIDELTV